MLKMKQYIIAIIGIMVALCIFTPNISQAALTVDQLKNGANEGATVNTGLTDLERRSDMYCLQHPSSLSYGYYPFTVSKYIEITGNTATNTSGVQTHNVENGAMAYIIANGNGYGTVGSKTTSQLAMWYYKANWCSANTKLGNFGAFSSRDYASKVDLVRQAEAYANRIGDTSQETVEDKTDKNNIKKTLVSKGEEYYIEVGPFNYVFPGSISSMEAKDQNGKTIGASDIKFLTKTVSNGKTVRKEINPQDIQSGKNFYVAVKSTSNVQQITKITGRIKQDPVYTAKMWFLSSAWYQNLLVTSHGLSTPGLLNLDFTYDIPLTGSVEIEKVDEDNNNIKLANVGFIIQYKESGKYIRQENGKTSYVSKENATVFRTGADGKIKIGNLIIGRYYFYEVENPNYGYKAEPEKAIACAINSGTKYKKIGNKNLLENLKIEKVDQDNNQRKLANVGFIVQSKETGKYLRKQEGDVPYTYDNERKDATVFRTGEDGTLTIPDVWKGTYYFYEVDNPNYGYKPDSEKAIECKTNKSATYQKINNEELLGDIEIEKVDQDNNEKKLANVGFIVQSKETGKYLCTQEGDVPYTYNNEREKATIFRTGTDGKLSIPDVWIGTYYFYEVDNPIYGYKPDPEKAIECQINKRANYQKVENERLLGSIEIEKVDKDHNEYKLANVGFIVQSKETGKYLCTQEGDVPYTYNNEREKATIFRTGTDGKLSIPDVWIGTYYFYEVENPNKGYDVEPEKAIECTVGKGANYQKIENLRKRGNIEIEKVDQDVNTFKLPNVGFVVQNKETKKYVHQENGVTTYVDSREDATIFRTDENGKLTVYDIEIATYYFYEVENPNKGYEADPEKPIECPMDRQDLDQSGTVYYKIENRRKYVDLSGFVWKDIASEKMSVRNNLYQAPSGVDGNDVRMEGIVVRLKDQEGKVIKETATDAEGNYLFVDAEIDQLPNYYIEFEYDGLIYENVTQWNKIKQEVLDRITASAVESGVTTESEKANWIKQMQETNGSKAAEGEARGQLNQDFAKVEGYDKDTVQAKDANGNATAQVDYTLDTSNGKAEILKTRGTTMTATTKNAEVTITYDRQSLLTELTGFNLGLYQRQQADVALTQDVKDVTVGIKGVYHVYEHGSRLNSDGDFTDDAWNVGVVYDDYQQPIYRADVVYRNESNPESELQVYLTYKVALRNQSSSITTTIYDIVDYYDSRYTIPEKGIGTELDENGKIKAGTELNYQARPSEGEYGIAKIELGNAGIKLEPTETRNFYIQFMLSRENIEAALNQGERLENVAEITSYTSYSDGELYAAVDKDAVLDNLTLGDKGTYEDDTREAPGIGLVVSEARAITGFVFEDEAIKEYLEQNLRLGNGSYEEAEKLISNVQVQLLEINGNNAVIAKNEKGEEIKYTTGQDGSYTLTGFTPGNYKIRFIWGDDTYPVTDYKATIFDKARYDKEMGDVYFYRNMQEEDKLKTHAMDDAAIRETIDKQLNSHGNGENNGYNYSTEVTQTTMNSDTPQMKFDVEYDKTEIKAADYVQGKLKFIVDGINLGIIRRPIQGINLDKRVSHIKVLYSSGEAIVDADIDEQGILSGQKDYVSYIKGTERRKSIVRVELDNEILQNASVEVTYDFTIANNSEIDYNTKDFYCYGILGTEDQKVTITPTRVIDYLGKESAYKICDENGQYGWERLNIEDIKGLVTEEVQKSEATQDVQIYQTQKLANVQIKPQGKEVVHMVVEKHLSSTKEDTNLMNQVEIVEIQKPSGSQVIDATTNQHMLLGNYEPVGRNAATEADDAMAETVVLLPSTGANKNYLPYIVISLTSLVVFAGGIYYIRKKLIK